MCCARAADVSAHRRAARSCPTGARCVGGCGAPVLSVWGGSRSPVVPCSSRCAAGVGSDRTVMWPICGRSEIHAVWMCNPAGCSDLWCRPAPSTMPTRCLAQPYRSADGLSHQDSSRLLLVSFPQSARRLEERAHRHLIVHYMYIHYTNRAQAPSSILTACLPLTHQPTLNTERPSTDLALRASGGQPKPQSLIAGTLTYHAAPTNSGVSEKKTHGG